ncbi:MAG: hypothetical protein GY697_10535 [Desulfobacterales bacterium]|nr:hypothetical protein [Desulfobacterales bacterium]
MRAEFGRVLVDLARRDDRIVLLVGDFGYGVVDAFAQSFPDRFFNMGIGEQAMISVAAGLALEGMKPYVYTITPFLIERPFEQIKIDIDQQKANVKLVGYADYPDQGPTHSELDAPALMRLFRNITAYFPKTIAETRQALHASYETPTPAFISLKKA